MSKEKMFSVGIMLLLLIVEFILPSVIESNGVVSTYDRRIQLLSLLCVLVFVFSIITWKIISKALICPYLFFYICLFLFCCGQSIGWAFGLSMGKRDLIIRSDYGLTHELLFQTLRYSIIAVTSFHLGALLFAKEENEKEPKWNSKDVVEVFDELGRVLLIIIIPAFAAETIQLIFAVVGGGYLASYDAIYSRSTFMKIISYLGDYYQPCLLLLLVSNREKKAKKIRILILLMFAVEIVTQFYIGGRNRAVLTLIGIFLAFHYFIKPMKRKQILIGSIIGYFVLALLNAIAVSRIRAGRGMFSVLSSLDLSPSSVFGGIIGELGWTMSSTSWTMRMVENKTGFQYGMTYMAAPLGVIPNLGFWAIHPAKAFDPSAWLQSYTHATYGLGYSMVAESYINFGQLGFIFMFVIGWIMVHFLGSSGRRDDSDLLATTFQIMFFMTLTKLLVRSTFASTVREIGYVLIPLYFLIWYRLQRKKQAKAET